LSPALIDAVRRQNPLDQALWESWRDANFGTSDVLPQPLAGLGRMGGLIHEARRPLMAVGRTALRQRPTWLRAARPQRGLRSGVYQADRARDAGKWQLAARLYRRALAEDPSLAAIWAQYGHMLWMLGDVAGTERAYREALRRAPVDADTRAQVDQGLRLIGWSDEAADAVRQAVMRCPKRGVAAAHTLLNR
jgi:tetratricopeptide (TPR) repeat protein